MLDITDFTITPADASPSGEPKTGAFKAAKFYGATDAHQDICSFCGKSFRERSPGCSVWPEDHRES